MLMRTQTCGWKQAARKELVSGAQAKLRGRGKFFFGGGGGGFAHKWATQHLLVAVGAKAGAGWPEGEAI
jgi:hypothetical protein